MTTLCEPVQITMESFLGTRGTRQGIRASNGFTSVAYNTTHISVLFIIALINVLQQEGFTLFGSQSCSRGKKKGLHRREDHQARFFFTKKDQEKRLAVATPTPSRHQEQQLAVPLEETFSAKYNDFKTPTISMEVCTKAIFLSGETKVIVTLHEPLQIAMNSFFGNVTHQTVQYRNAFSTLQYAFQQVPDREQLKLFNIAFKNVFQREGFTLSSSLRANGNDGACYFFTKDMEFFPNLIV